MTRRPSCPQVWIALGVALLGTSPLPAQTRSTAASAPGPVVWDKAYGSESLWTEFRAITAAPKRGVLVGVSQRNALDAPTATANRLFLWRIDPAGRLASEVEIRKSVSSATAGSTTAAIRDLTELEKDETLLLVDFEGGRPSIVRVDGAGKQTLTKEVARPGRALTLFKIVPAGAKFLLIGHEAFDALLMEVDGAGNLLWEKKFDRGKMEFFVDGMASGDDGFVLVGNSGQYDALRAGPSIVWVGRYDAGGALKAEVTFAGRYGRIAPARDGGVAVVYDRSATNDQEIHVKGLGADLKEAWDTPVVSATASFSDFKIAATPVGGFVIAGGKGGRPYAATVDAAGRVSTKFEGAAAPASLDVGSYGLASDQAGAFYLASSHVEAGDKATVRQRVRLRKVVM
jgi:hypothetical protein